MTGMPVRGGEVIIAFEWYTAEAFQDGHQKSSLHRTILMPALH